MTHHPMEERDPTPREILGSWHHSRLGDLAPPEHDTTINALVRELLQDALERESRVRAAVGRLLVVADRGPYFTTDPGSIPREELYERR